MKKSEIEVGGLYIANVSGNRVTVRVDSIGAKYRVTNLATGRKCEFKTAQRFLRVSSPALAAVAGKLSGSSAKPVEGQPSLPGANEGETFPEFLARTGSEPLPARKPVSTASEDKPAKYVAEADKGPENAPPAVLSSIAGIRAKTKAAYLEDSPTSGAGPHVIVEALAGTGKTTTFETALQYMKGITPAITPSPQQLAVWEEFARSSDAESIAMVAFNSAIAKELHKRVGKWATACTLHSMGRRAVTNAIRLRSGQDAVSGWKTSDLVQAITGKKRSQIDPSFMASVNSLVGLCKSNLVGKFDGEEYHVEGEQLDRLARRYDVGMGKYRKWIIPMVNQVLTKCANVSDGGYIDYNDMIWLPIVRDLECFRYDLLGCDEAQDTNPAGQELTIKCGRRIIYCGDKHQAIYGFTGADSRSMDTLYERLVKSDRGCIRLPLTVTRRCGKSIVREAQQTVPAFEAHESNPEGEIVEAVFRNGGSASGREGYEGTPEDNPRPNYRELVKPGDMVICRVNAPLVSECFNMISRGVPARIQGRNIGTKLVKLIEQLGPSTITELEVSVKDWAKDQLDREAAQENPDENRMINIQDQARCISALSRNSKAVFEVKAKIEELFSDEGNSDNCVLFTSGHKSKGLEADRVFLLIHDKAPIPHPMAKQPWAIEQEWNLWYVMQTRAKELLCYVR